MCMAPTGDGETALHEPLRVTDIGTQLWFCGQGKTQRQDASALACTSGRERRDVLLTAEKCQANRITPVAASMSTYVVIGPGVFGLQGQVAELAVAPFPFTFLDAAALPGVGARLHISMSHTHSTAGH